MGRSAAFRKIKAVAAPPTPAEPLKLDLGCGPNKKAGFIGADAISFVGVDVVTDLRKRWPWPDNSVGEAHSSHFIEHLTAMERVHFFNELYRVLQPNAACQIAVPHWASCRAYGDPSHQWPPFSEFAMYYLNRDWRAINAPHTDWQHMEGGFNCHFDATWGYSMRQDLVTRNQEYQQFALANYKEAAQDLIGTLKAIK